MLGDLFLLVFTSVWLLLPGYMANPAAVLTGGGTPIDFGKDWKDGFPILGKGKTWRGLAGGIFAGMGIGFLQGLLVEAGLPLPGFGAIPEAILVLFALSFGALFGDSAKSFIKRRMDLERGAHSPYFMDQLDFVVGAWFFCLLLVPGWFLSTFTLGNIIVLLILTPTLHRLTNILAYKLGQKDVPW